MNANPLDYDAKYPQTADTHTNEKAKIELMMQNIGREVWFQTEDGIQYYAIITSVSNSNHYKVNIKSQCEKLTFKDINYIWEWYVREEAIHFVENIY